MLNVSLSLSNKAVSKATVATLKERLMRDCDRLLNTEPSRHFDTKAYDLPAKKVEAVRYMAAVEAALGNISKAEHLYDRRRTLTTAWLAASKPCVAWSTWRFSKLTRNETSTGRSTGCTSCWSA